MVDPMPPEAAEAAGTQEKFALTTSRHFSRMAGAHGREPRLHHLSGRQAVLPRPAAGRPARRVRAQLRALHGARRRGRRAARWCWPRSYQLCASTTSCRQAAAQGDHDAVFVPHAGWITGDLDVHDVAHPAATAGRCSSTRCSPASPRPATATASGRCGGRPSSAGWRRRTAAISTALRWQDGKPRYVTLVADSDVADGWRDHRAGGGMLMDIAEQRARCCAACRCRIRRACTTAGCGCSIPAPASSASSIASASKFEPVAFCPGYARGLAFIGRYAVVGLSLPRENRTFQGLPLDEALAARGATARCGLLVVDTSTRRHGRMGAHRGRGARTVRRCGSARRPQSGRDRLQDRRDQARHLD